MIDYRIEPADPAAHQYQVTLTVPRPALRQVLTLPVWIPGSYLVREFARHLSALKARQGGRDCTVEQTDKARWVVSCDGRSSLRVSYRAYAFDTSVRAAYLDPRRGFFNGTGMCLRVEGREHEPHRVELASLPRGWDAATAMTALPGRRRRYLSADYDELVDHPFELGRFWRGSCNARGVEHHLVVAGAWPGFDSRRLLADVQRLCEHQIAFWHGGGPKARPPFGRYVFLLNLAEDGHGGLEHRASTALLSSRRNLPRVGAAGTDDGYVDLLGLMSHEYFHAWHVKRLKPREFERIDYARENYTRLLWFFEGATSYYDDLLLLRAGLIDSPRYLRLLAKTINAVQATPGRYAHSVAEASFEAWIKYYRPDENSPNATVSYYAKGALVALALDLSLRAQGGSLDAVMRRLWQTSRGGAINEADLAAALQHVGGRSYERELRRWVHGVHELPLAELLAAMAIEVSDEPAGFAASLGLRLAEGPITGVQVKTVLAGGAAARAGLSAGDELVAVDGWRLRKLDDALAWLRAGQAFELTLVRDQRLQTLTVRPDPRSVYGRSVKLALSARADAAALARRRAWLGT